MRYLVCLALTVAALILLKTKEKLRGIVIVSFVAVIMILNLCLVKLQLHTLIPTYRPTNQTFYQEDFRKKGEYPDSLLILLFKDKNVYTKDNRYLLYQTELENKSFHYAYYHQFNAWNFIDFAGGNIIPLKELNKKNISEEQLNNSFSDLGYANDMLRYTFMLNDYEEEIGNYFSYYWYYYEHLDALHVYLCTADDLFEASELVVLWDNSKTKEEENLYIMTKEYYESEVASNE